MSGSRVEEERSDGVGKKSFYVVKEGRTCGGGLGSKARGGGNRVGGEDWKEEPGNAPINEASSGILHRLVNAVNRWSKALVREGGSGVGVLKFCLRCKIGTRSGVREGGKSGTVGVRSSPLSPQRTGVRIDVYVVVVDQRHNE